MSSIVDSELAEDDNVVRYVKPTSVHEDGSVDGSAFCLRPDETGLSVSWLEYFEDSSKAGQLAQVRRLARIRMRPRGRLAELNVGLTTVETRDDAELRFERRPFPEEHGYAPDPSHSEILGLPAVDSPLAALVGDRIAYSVTETHPAV